MPLPKDPEKRKLALKRMSESHIGKNKGGNNYFYGKHHSEETKKKISVAKKGSIPWIKGKTHSMESRAKISNAHLGKKLSEETRKKMSKAQKLIGNKPPSRMGRKFTEETKRKLSEQKLGEKNPSWRGGRTSITERIRGSREYKLWKQAVFERDNRICIWCGSKKDIEADHIKRFSLYPELRFAIDNGRTLCHECHKTTETYGNYPRD